MDEDEKIFWEKSEWHTVNSIMKCCFCFSKIFGQCELFV
uniref:Uncharacterized protein n=1 Tax=Rhizophora mucronata TaxID=61149 RepID=A0A2P2P668_RHIMU